MGYDEEHVRRNRSWDLANMDTFSCRVRLDVGAQFRRMMDEAGTTPGAFLKELVLDYVREHGGDISSQKSAGKADKQPKSVLSM